MRHTAHPSRGLLAGRHHEEQVGSNGHMHGQPALGGWWWANKGHGEAVGVGAREEEEMG